MERREGEQGEVSWRTIELSLYIGAEGGGGDGRWLRRSNGRR
jgi:hypothetical protein